MNEQETIVGYNGRLQTFDIGVIASVCTHFLNMCYIILLDDDIIMLLS